LLKEGNGFDVASSIVEQVAGMTAARRFVGSFTSMSSVRSDVPSSNGAADAVVADVDTRLEAGGGGGPSSVAKM
jgi:hypothetical protein